MLSITVPANPLTCSTMSEYIDLEGSAIVRGQLSLDEVGDQLIALMG